MAAEKAGLELGGGGYPFAGSVVNKGCYTYATGTYKGFAFYGLGGDSKTNSELFDVTKKYYRPEGYDCSSSNFVQNNSKQTFNIYYVFENCMESFISELSIISHRC